MQVTRKPSFSVLTLAALSLLTAGTAHSTPTESNSAPAAPSGGLRALAESFLDKLSPVYERTDPAFTDPLSGIPDGTTLLLKPRIDRLLYEGDIYAIKHENDIFLSLSDVISVLELAVDFDEEAGIGTGWFLREDWELEINLPENQVVSRGQTFTVSPSNLHEEDGILFVRGTAIEDWMEFAFNYDISQQYIEIASAHPLPAVARNERRLRGDRSRMSRNEAQLPRVEQAEKLFDINSADIRLSSRYRRNSGGDSNIGHDANIALEGQLLNHNSYALVNLDNRESIRSVRTRFNRQSEDPELLGPLNARFYELGDTNAVNVPLTGGGGNALGFRVNNNPLVNSNFNTTDIEGDAPPGWDVELLRNGVLIDTQTITEDGRYDFDDAQLFAGDNNFELIFYGPQGEIRRETLNVPVTPELLQTQRNTYDISVQLEDRSTYDSLPIEDDDRGEPDVSARYNMFLGPNLVYAGLRSRSIGGERKSFGAAGVTRSIGGTLYDANFAIDDEANTAVQVGARRDWAGWDLAANATWRGDEFIDSESDTPTTLQLSANAQRRLTDLIGTNTNFLTNATYEENADGDTVFSSRVGLSTQIDRVSFSNNLRYEKRDFTEANNITDDEELRNNFSVRGSMGKFFLRGGFDYEFKPENQVERYFSQVQYRHDPRKTTDLLLEHSPNTDFSRGRLNFNYVNDYFRTTPFVEVNSNDEINAGVNLNFDLLDTPNQTLPEITSQNILGRGLASIFVFHDKNGNFIYDGADEVLPDVIVESVNVRRRATTNESGYATITSLSTAQPTDIVIDENTLPDSFMVSAFPGVSVFPIAGQKHILTFPVHLSGEVDGIMYLEDESGNRRPYTNRKVVLIPIDEAERTPIETQSMFDGFFLFSRVPPGRYILLPAASTVGRNIGNLQPQYIDIAFDGTIMANQDIILKRGTGFVPYDVRYIEAKPGEPAGLSYVMEVDRSAKSELSGLLQSLLMNWRGQSAVRGLQILSEENNLSTYTGTKDELHRACAKLSTLNVDCSVVIQVHTIPDLSVAGL